MKDQEGLHRKSMYLNALILIYQLLGGYVLFCVITQPKVSFFNTLCKTCRSHVQGSISHRRKPEVTQFIVGFAVHKTKNCSLHDKVIYSVKTQHISVINTINLATCFGSPKHFQDDS